MAAEMDSLTPEKDRTVPQKPHYKGWPMNARLRFEILKRDRFTCRYCGASAPDVPLHVDHLRAVADGGADEPDNLVTACSDCNLGKAAIPLAVPQDEFQARHRAPPRRRERIVEDDGDGPPLFIPVADLYAFGPPELPVSRHMARLLLAVLEMQGKPTSYSALAEAWGWHRNKVRRFLQAVQSQEPMVTAVRQ